MSNHSYYLLLYFQENILFQKLFNKLHFPLAHVMTHFPLSLSPLITFLQKQLIDSKTTHHDSESNDTPGNTKW